MDERSDLNNILKAHTEIVKENTEVQKILIHAIRDNNKQKPRVLWYGSYKTL